MSKIPQSGCGVDVLLEQWLRAAYLDRLHVVHDPSAHHLPTFRWFLLAQIRRPRQHHSGCFAGTHRPSAGRGSAPLDRLLPALSLPPTRRLRRHQRRPSRRARRTPPLAPPGPPGVLHRRAIRSPSKPVPRWTPGDRTRTSEEGMPGNIPRSLKLSFPMLDQLAHRRQSPSSTREGPSVEYPLPRVQFRSTRIPRSSACAGKPNEHEPSGSTGDARYHGCFSKDPFH